MPPLKKVIDSIDSYVSFFKSWSKSDLQADIDDLNYTFVDGLGGQVALYIDPAMKAACTFWKNQFSKLNVTWPAGNKIVVMEDIGKEAADKWYCGVIFHEFGHGALTVLGKNGSAVKEKNACAVELMALAKYLEGKTDVTAAAKSFALARKEKKLYSFTSDFEDKAKAAYQQITGQALS